MSIPFNIFKTRHYLPNLFRFALISPCTSKQELVDMLCCISLLSGWWNIDQYSRPNAGDRDRLEKIKYFAIRRQLYIVGCEVFQFLFITSNHWKSLSPFLHLTAACYWGSGQVAPSLSHPKVPPLSFMAQVTTMSVTSLVLRSSHFLATVNTSAIPRLTHGWKSWRAHCLTFALDNRHHAY